jgi:hypothetical protein
MSYAHVAFASLGAIQAASLFNGKPRKGASSCKAIDARVGAGLRQ